PGKAFSLPDVPADPGLPGKPGVRPGTRCSWERGETVPAQHAELDAVAGHVVAVRVLDRRPRLVGQDDQLAARGVRPQHVLDLARVQPGDGPPAQDLHDLSGGAENSVKASSLDSGCLVRFSVAATILLPSGVMMALKPNSTLLIFPCT